MSYVPDTMRKRIYDKDNNQKIDIDVIPDLPRSKITDLFNSPFWDNIPDKPNIFRNIGFKVVDELPPTPEDYEIVFYNGTPMFYDPNKGKWGKIQVVFESEGYSGFDNNGGGVWTKYINIPITTSPSEYAQYKVVIDSNNVTVYSVDGTQKTQGAVASDFWANVKSDGLDIRVFDQAKEQLYFWIEEFDYSNMKAVIWVKLEAGSSELNIAYGNPSATKSDYENGEQVFELFDDFTDGVIDTSKYEYSGNVVEENGILTLRRSGSDAYIYTKQYFGNGYGVIAKSKIANTDNEWAVSFEGYIAGLADDFLVIRKYKSYSSSAWWLAVQDDSATNRSTASYGTLDSDWHVFEILWVSSSEARFYIDGELAWTATGANVPDGDNPLPVVWRVVATEGAQTDVDWFGVFKLADPADFGTPQILEF